MGGGTRGGKEMVRLEWKKVDKEGTEGAVRGTRGGKKRKGGTRMKKRVDRGTGGEGTGGEPGGGTSLEKWVKRGDGRLGGGGMEEERGEGGTRMEKGGQSRTGG